MNPGNEEVFDRGSNGRFERSKTYRTCKNVEKVPQPMRSDRWISCRKFENKKKPLYYANALAHDAPFLLFG